MVEGPRAVPVDRIDELIQLCNRIFRSSGGDMGAEYPLVFDRGQPDNMRVILEDGKIVSHIGLCIRDASILGRTLRTASIGAVCTDPEHRNRGHAWALLNDCLIRSQEQGVHVILISGDRSLYRRFGGCRPGSFHQTEVAGAPLPAGLGLDLASPGDASTLVKLHQGESVRFIRPAHDWERLLRSGMLMNRSADCWIVRDAEAALGYIAVQRPASHSQGDTLPRVREYAGARNAVWSGIQALATHYGSATIGVAVMPGDADVLSRARMADLPIHRHTFEGTTLFADVGAAVEALQPLWAERHSAEIVERLRLKADLDGLEHASDSGTIRLDGSQAIQAIFGRESGERGDDSILPGIDPLPYLDSGYNYV